MLEWRFSGAFFDWVANSCAPVSFRRDIHFWVPALCWTWPRIAPVSLAAQPRFLRPSPKRAPPDQELSTPAKGPHHYVNFIISYIFWNVYQNDHKTLKTLKICCLVPRIVTRIRALLIGFWHKCCPLLFSAFRLLRSVNYLSSQLWRRIFRGSRIL